VESQNGFCAVYLSTVSALRLDCTVSAKRVKKKMFLGEVGCPGFSGFRFSGKKIPYSTRPREKNAAKRKIVLATRSPVPIVAPLPRTAQPINQTNKQKT
jgi:hypothetical protein